MKRWALAAIVLYAAVLAGLVFLLWWAAFGERPDVVEFYRCPVLLIGVGLMVLCQVVMLALPVRLATKRPVTRIWIFWPMLAAGVMFVVLAVGMGFVVWETAVRAWGQEIWGSGYSPPAWALMATVVAFWLAWALVFGFHCGRAEPVGLVRRTVKWLIAGSIVELLVAIPAHVYARSKDQCCGGMWTVWGLAAGIAVMLFAFGPGVFLLFTRRLRSIQQKSGREQGSAAPS